MSKEKLDQVGVNISEKAKLIWNVADLIVGPFIENIPLKEDIQEYFKREVLPYAPDAWIDESATKLGYEIPMTRYFYEYAEPESIETIEGRISALEKKIADSVNAVFHRE